MMKRVQYFPVFSGFNARKGRQGRGALIRTAVAILVVCAMLLSQFSYSLIQATGVGDIPTEVYAADDTSGMVEGHSILGDSVNTADAQTVYYAGTAWRVIAYNGTGNNALKLSTSNIMTLIASDTLSSIGTVKFSTIYKKNLECQEYSKSSLKSVIDNYWSGSDFSDLEKKTVLSRTLSGGASYTKTAPYTNSVAGGSVSNAYLWPLSTQEAYYLGHGNTDTGSTAATNENKLRKASKTSWLRSPGGGSKTTGYNAAEISETGAAGYFGDQVDCDRSVRPAFNLNLESILITSAATGGKSSGTTGAGCLQEVTANSGSEWKLTLKDDGTITELSGHTGFFAERVGEGDVLAGGNIKINYSGAQTGDNEYVSVFLKDSSGKIVYYGHLAQQSESGTEVALTIPENTTPGTYTVGVFAEQCNGDKKTDYASAISTFPLTVVTHSHVFTYSVGTVDDSDTITATCTNTETACPLDDGHGNCKVDLTIVKPARTVFGGSGSEKATLNGLEDFNSATGKSVSASDIKYVGRDGTSYDESTTAPTDAGKYTAKITLNDVKVGDNENGSVTASVDYEIAKAAGSISYGSGNVNKKYGDKAFTYTLSHTGDGTVTYSSSEPTVATVDEKSGEVTVARVGNTTIKATVADSNNYSYDSKEASYTLTVNKGSGSISYADASVAKTYGAAAFTNPLTKTGDGTVTYSSSEPTVATVDTEGEVTIVGVGSATITATVEDTDNCTYAVKEASYTLTVSKSNQTINAADMSLTYGGSGDVEAIITNGDGAISYAVKSGSEDYIDVDSTTGAVTVKSVPTDANTKAYITVTARSTDHYNEATKDVAVTINKATITITANDYNISVGEQIPELNSEECYNVSVLVGNDALTTTPTLKYQQSGSDVALSGTATASNLGTYDIVPTGADAGGNYAIDYVKGTLTINKATPTVTAPVPKELTFNGGDQELVTGGTTSGGEMQYAIGSESGPTGSWSTDIPEATDAGTYYVWYKVVGGSDYSDIEAAPVEVVISPKSIANATVTLNETKYLYDGESHDVAVSSVVLDGIPLTEGTDFSVSGTLSGIDKGTYTVTVTALDDSNYTGETTVDWSIGMETPVITPPTSTPITYGQTLGESALNGGEASVGDTSVDGTFTWKASSLTPEVSDSNTTEYEVIFTPDNMESYTTASCFVTVTVNKAVSPSDNPAPTPKKELTDNGHPQELVNTVPVTGGTIEYVIGTDDKTPPTSGWGSDIPTASKPGAYYIWYKVVGDENHFDSDPKCIVVTIEKPVYSNYEGDGGKWTKGSTDGLKFTFKRSAEDVTTIEHFAGILVDGKEVAESNYDAVSGSVVITLKAPYLETLSAGEHILTAKFNDGDSADAGFTIIKAPAADDNNASKAGDDSKSGGTADSNESKKTDVKNPETGDEVPIGLIMIIGLASLVGAVWSLVLKKNLKPTKK